MSDRELSREQLREAIHQSGLTRKEQALLVLLALGKPASQGEIKAAALDAGLREMLNWNLTRILQSMTGQAVQTPNGWELLDQAKRRGRELAGIASPSATGPKANPAASSSPAAATREQGDVDIFISHAGRDATITSALVNLLVAAFGLPKNAIRCTSVPGCRLTPGVDANVQLAHDIDVARVFIGLLTDASVESTYVLFELGARWGARRSIIPLVGPTADFKLLPAPIAPRHALRTTARTDLQEMLAEIAKGLGKTLRPAHEYEIELEALVAARVAPTPPPAAGALSTRPRTPPKKLRRK